MPRLSEARNLNEGRVGISDPNQPRITASQPSLPNVPPPDDWVYNTNWQDYGGRSPSPLGSASTEPTSPFRSIADKLRGIPSDIIQIPPNKEPAAASAEPSLQDLYPEKPEVTVADPTFSGSVESDKSVTETGGASTVAKEPGQMADEELARILSQDSPLMARARTEGAKWANQRGLMNTSMAAGATMGAMVDRAMPMALQNARVNLERGVFNAQQENDIKALEAQLRTALEEGDTRAANDALRQMDAINRDAQAQQADIDYGFESQIIQSVTALNEQYLRGTQAIDLENIKGSWQQLITTNEVAGSFWTNGMQAIANVMSNPDMTPQQIANAVQQITKMINGGLEMIDSINDMDFSDLGGTTTPPPGPGPRGGGGGGGRRYEYR